MNVGRGTVNAGGKIYSELPLIWTPEMWSPPCEATSLNQDTLTGQGVQRIVNGHSPGHHTNLLLFLEGGLSIAAGIQDSC